MNIYFIQKRNDSKENKMNTYKKLLINSFPYLLK